MPLSRLDSTVIPFVRGRPPQNPAELNIFLTNELTRIETTLAQVTNLVPQVAISAPRVPLLGMIRYAKAPWNPLGTGNGWVRYNGTTWIAL